ncbi:MAG TPA: LytTR family DNA-binding domain-containing protein [Lachnospiraceae bacterium]|nr:LytTR family DNA-binding domain-containing protein [Lachnospiraceae bacterium]
MKIIIEETQLDEDEVVIRCNRMSDDILQLISYIKSNKNVIVGYENDHIHRLEPADVYYFEAVDNKVFLYCKKEVYESKQKLYELENELISHNFFRISKSVVVNLSKIKYISPAFNGRFEATMLNGEKVIISRQYVPEFKKKLTGE